MTTCTTRWLLATTTAAILLAALVTTATARTLSANEQGFRVTWSSLEFVTSFTTVRCRLTLDGSFNTRTIAKARGTIGAISRAIFGHACTGGEVWADNGTEAEPLGTAPNKLPFILSYESFAGTLPNISSVDFLLRRVSYVLRSTVLGLTCQGRYGRPEDNILLTAAREASGGLTTVVPSATLNRFSLVEQLGPNAVCPATGAFRGEASVSNLAGSGRVTVTLI